MKNKTTFSEWIGRVGIQTLTSQMSVTETTVQNWKAGRCYPRVHQMRQIKRLSRGIITYDKIIDPR